jgi:hypothetical protein
VVRTVDRDGHLDARPSNSAEVERAIARRSRIRKKTPPGAKLSAALVNSSVGRLATRREAPREERKT